MTSQFSILSRYIGAQFSSKGIVFLAILLLSFISKSSFADNDSITNEKLNISCSAKFLILLDSSHARTVRFVNVSQAHGLQLGDSIKFRWNFGDMTQSNNPEPKHTFLSSDYYNVCLTMQIISKKDTNEVICASNICKLVLIGNPGNFNFGGQVFEGKFPVHRAKADIFRVRPDNSVMAAGTMNFDTLGFFYFYQMVEGNYFIKITPENPAFFPTYFGNSLVWNHAQKLEIRKNFFSANINLVPVKPVNGPAVINGQINADNTHVLIMKNIEVILADANMNPLMFTYTDSRGRFAFPNIAFGKYILYADEIGWISSEHSVYLNEASPVINSVLSLSFPSVESVQNISHTNGLIVSNPFPNPVSDKLNISISSSGNSGCRMEIFNIAGVHFSNYDLQLNSQDHNLSFDISNLPKGVYFIRISDTGNSIPAVRKFIKY